MYNAFFFFQKALGKLSYVNATLHELMLCYNTKKTMYNKNDYTKLKSKVTRIAIWERHSGRDKPRRKAELTQFAPVHVGGFDGGQRVYGIRYTLDCGIHARLTRPKLKLPSDLTVDSVVDGCDPRIGRSAEEYRQVQYR